MMRWFQRFLQLGAVVLLSACVFSACGCAGEGIGESEPDADIVGEDANASGEEPAPPDSAVDQEGTE